MMAPDFVAIDAADKGTYTKTLDYLYEAALRVVRRKQHEQYMTEIAGASASRAAPAQNKAGEGNKQACISCSKSGKCRFGDGCRYEHVSKGARRDRDAAGSAETGGKKGDGAQSSETSGKNECILFVWNGSCLYGERCKYVRPPQTGAGTRASAVPSIVVAATETEHSDPRWILDTGASVHLCGKAVNGQIIDLEPPVTLETANGQITVSDGVRIDIEGVGKGIPCAKMPCDVQALSIWATLRAGRVQFGLEAV